MSADATLVVLLLSGPNLNLLGERQAEAEPTQPARWSASEALPRRCR